MKTRTDITKKAVLSHFSARAVKYDDSSKWCTDQNLLEQIFEYLSPGPHAVILDTACGTGLVSQVFHDRVGKIFGVDITEAMFLQAKKHTDFLVNSSAETLPFKTGIFDVCLERQGIQFMDAGTAVAEMARVTKPGGKICTIQLCAYGEEDQEEYFEILKLRNPARNNFFIREDLGNLLEDAGCVDVAVHDFISVEDVDRWSDTGAIPETNREGIRDVYRKASDNFNRYHAVEIGQDGRIVDKMLFGIGVGSIPS